VQGLHGRYNVILPEPWNIFGMAEFDMFYPVVNSVSSLFVNFHIFLPGRCNRIEHRFDRTITDTMSSNLQSESVGKGNENIKVHLVKFGNAGRGLLIQSEGCVLFNDPIHENLYGIASDLGMRRKVRRHVLFGMRIGSLGMVFVMFVLDDITDMF